MVSLVLFQRCFGGSQSYIPQLRTRTCRTRRDGRAVVFVDCNECGKICPFRALTFYEVSTCSTLTVGWGVGGTSSRFLSW